MPRSFVPLALCLLVAAPALAQDKATRPNVLLIITDDQGHGDLGFHGNPVIKTPHLDRLARESTRLTKFHVSPVCSPTRSSLMTGRYNYRTRVVDTFIGRSMMDPDEVTLAERLAAAGYKTGIFGKWHLGDNYPMRPIDQGFQEALVLKGGGIGQPSDPPDGTSYFDPVLQHNGKPEKREGYCSDIFADAAMAFAAEARKANTPFFIYLPFNCPHDPLEVPDEYRKLYDEEELSHLHFPEKGYPLPREAPRDVTAKVYGMITNIDENLGRLFARLERLGVEQDTLVVFLTDNGPAHPRYVSGMRGRKGTVHDGGIHVPCFLRWPGTLQAGREIDRIAAHIDLTPTILEACGVPAAGEPVLDGRSLWPLMTGHGRASDWPDRTLFLQWHRGDVPEKFRAFAAREQRYKLVSAERGPNARPTPFELFDMEADPYEQHDIAGANPEVVARLKLAYERWFDDVSRSRGFDPPRIVIGSRHENPSTLTRQDWRGPRAGWGPDVLGHWEVRIDRPGTYRIHAALHGPKAKPVPAGKVRVRFGGVNREQSFGPDASNCVLERVELPAVSGSLEAWVDRDGATTGVWSLTVERIE